MEYNASATKYRFWFVEAKETARLMGAYDAEQIKEMVIETNLYQQKQQSRLINEYGCIKKRLDTLPDELRKMLITSELNTAKLINFVACMAADPLLFDLMYDVYRNKIFMGDERISEADLNIFFKDKQDQNEKVAGFTDVSIKKLKQVYTKYMLEAGLLTGKSSERIISKPYIEPDLAYALQRNAMEKYLRVFTGKA